jgi:nitrogen fixation protein NifU and related proteins
MNEELELILDHAEHGRNWSLLPNADIDHDEHNPLCGDHIHVTAVISEGAIARIGWEGDGCALSQGTASLLGEAILGKSLDDISTMTADDVYALIELRPMLNRVKCALLSLQAVQRGIQKYKTPHA